MDSSSHFASIPLRASRGFSWIFLIELIVTGIGAVFVLFFFNRVIATILSLSLRWYTWHKYRVFIDLRAIQVSFLGGRVFFKDLRYLGSNEAIFVTQGHITWRYWLNRTRRLDLKTADSKKEKNEGLPSRFVLSLEGVEWFVYNRTPAYDAALKEYEDGTGHTDSTGMFRNEKTVNVHDEPKESEDSSALGGGLKEKISGDSSVTGDPTTSQSPFTTQEACAGSDDIGKISPILRFLPVDILCQTGAMVVGNFRTPTIMIYHFASATGSADACPSRSPLDQYKMVYEFKFKKPSIQLKANMDYKQPHADSVSSIPGKHKMNTMDLNRNYKPSKWQSFVDLFLFFHGRFFHPAIKQPGDDVTDGPWQGLSRYLDDDEPGQAEESEVVEEYAKNTSILDAEEGRLKFYYDIAGKVPYNAELLKERDMKEVEVGNGGQAPQWGIDLHLSGATIQYGPWTDRQRTILQSIFFPGVHIDSKPSNMLAPGEYRIATEFRLYVELDDSTILRIPIREPSHDKEFKRQVEANGNTTRSFGWLELKMSELSTLTFSSALVPAKYGWPRWLTGEFNGVELRSSVNHDILWSSKKYLINGDLTSPLKWNGLTTWTFNNEAANAKCFLLREHVTILTDMITDFGSGPATPYAAFVPQKYVLNFDLTDFSLYLNVNDSNIISNPTDFDDNVFLDFSSPSLHGNIIVPLVDISPISNQVQYAIKAETLDLILHAPPWNTQASFLQSKDIGKVKDFVLEGSYTYSVSPRLPSIDTLCLNASTGYISLITYGFLIRYLIKVRENYFGDNTHFKTLDEFTRSVAAADQQKFGVYCPPAESADDDMSDIEGSDEDKEKSPLYIEVESTTDVLVTFRINSGCLIIPTNIYSVSSHLRLDMDMFDVNLRFTNYYMDLQMNISPIQGVLAELPADEVLTTSKKDVGKTNPDLFIDGIAVYGHRMFGLPPTEPTYVCNWDIDFGILFTEGSSVLYQNLSSALAAFVYTFADKENALIVTEPPLYDATFLRIRLPSLRMLVHTELATLELMTESISLSLSDLGTYTYNSRMSLKIPSLSLLCRDRFEDKSLPSRVTAFFTTSLYVTNFDRKERAFERLRMQQEHLRKHDMPFNRIPFLLMTEMESVTSFDIDDKELAKIPVTLPMPPMPPSLVSSNMSSLAWNGYNMGISDAHSIDSSASLSSVIHHDLSREPALNTEATKSYMDLYDLSCHNANQERDSDFNSTFMPPYSCDLECVKNGFDRVIYEMDESMIQSDPSSARPLDNLDTQYDSYVVEFRGGIDGFLSSASIETIVELLDSLSKPDLVSMLDDLQIDVMERLERNLIIVALVTSARVVIPGLHVRYGSIDNKLTDCTMIPTTIKMGDHVDLDIRAITLSFRVTDRSTSAAVDQFTRRNPVTRMRGICTSLDQVTIGMVPAGYSARAKQPDPKLVPLELQLERLEVWNHKTKTNVTSIKIKSMGIVGQNENMKWIVSTALDILEPLIPISEKLAKIQKRQNNRLKNMVFLIVLASNAYEIAHDPAFLTRPAYVLRSSKAHIRANDSWKLMTRIRHIYRSLPPNIRYGIRHDLSLDDVAPPPDAKDKVIQIMMDWRSWEMIDISTSYIFSHIFDDEGKIVTVTSTDASLLLDVETVTIYIANGSEHEDYLQLSYLTLSISSNRTDTSPNLQSASMASVESPIPTTQALMQRKQAQERITVNLSAGCEEVRIITNWNTLSLIEDVNGVLRARLPAFQQTEKLPLAESPQILPEIKPKIEIRAVFTIKTFICVLNSNSFRIQTSGHSLQSTLSGFIHNKNAPPSSFLLKALAFEFDVLGSSSAGEKRLLTLGIQNSDLWISASGLPHPSNVRGYVRVDELLLELLEDSIGLASVLSRVIDNEVQQFFKMFPQLAHQSKPEVETASATEISTIAEQSQKVGLSFDLRNYQIILNVLPSLKYIIRGSAVQIIATPAIDNIRSIAFESGEQYHEFRQRKKSRESKITSTTLPTVTTLIRIENTDVDAQAMDVRIRMHTVNFDASSFPTLASVLSGDVTKAQLLKAQSLWRAVLTRLDSVLPDRFTTAATTAAAKPSASPKLSRTSLRGSLFIKGVVVKAESKTSQIIMSIDDIKVEGSTLSNKVLDKDVSRISLLANFPRVAVTIVNRQFRDGKFLVFDSNLIFSCKTVEDSSDPKSMRHAIAVKSEKCIFELSSFSSTLMVEILSQFEESLTSIELPEELFHLSNILKENGQPANEDQEMQNWDGVFKALLRIQLNGVTFHWVSDDLIGHDQVAKEMFYLSVGSNSISLSSKGRGLIHIAAKQFEMICDEKATAILPSGTDSAMSKKNSSMIPLVVLCVSLNLVDSNRALGLSIKSDEVKTRIVPSVVKLASAIAVSFSTTAEIVSEKIANYKSRSAAHASTGPTPEPAVSSVQNYFKSANVKADFAGSTIELIGATNDKYTEEPSLSRRGSIFNTKSEANFGKTKERKVGPVATFRVPGIHVLLDHVVYPSPQTLRVQIFVEPSVNTLYPRVMPVVMEMVQFFQDTIREPKNSAFESIDAKPSTTTSSPAEILGNIRLNLGLRVGRQEFALSCEPIAKVAAMAAFDELYLTMSSFHRTTSTRVFTSALQLFNMKASLQHIYSRESSGLISTRELTFAALSSYKTGRITGLSMVGNVNETNLELNIKQSHDLLLFQDIWSPDLVLDRSQVKKTADEQAEILMQRYHRVSSTNAFPWNIDFQLKTFKSSIDLGQSLGKLEFDLDKMWLASRKSSDWEQNLAFGFSHLVADCKGRLGGSLEINGIRVRSAIRWEVLEDGRIGVPLVQISAGVETLKTKVYFDYRLFLIAVCEAVHLTMFNQRGTPQNSFDRLVCVADCDAIKVYLTVLAPSNILAILSAIQRLNQEQAASYQAVLRDSERFKVVNAVELPEPVSEPVIEDLPVRLGTELDVSIRTVIIDVFPSALTDTEILRVEASNICARFGISVEHGKLRSRLELMLGQLLVALSTTKGVQDDLNLVAIEQFVKMIGEAKGGTIFKIPAVSVSMKTWQPIEDMKTVEFIFSSMFEGRLDVGWNLGSINFIRDMWNTHVRSFQLRQVAAADGKNFGTHLLESEELEKKIKEVELNKSYTYIPLEPPIIATPQLRDMGEATPPLEWIGLNRDRFPGLTHQAIIITLQSLSRKVEMAYSNVLGKA